MAELSQANGLTELYSEKKNQVESMQMPSCLKDQSGADKPGTKIHILSFGRVHNGLQNLSDVLFQFGRSSSRGETFYRFSILINEELGEIPFYLIAQPARELCAQVREDRV